MDLLKFFSTCGLTPRPQQSEILTKIQDTWGQYKYIAINAPTGVGKTHVALAIADVLSKSYILTGTKDLQAQYEHTSAKIVNIKGRNNYQCQINPIFQVDEAPCLADKQLKGDCIRRGICDYYRQKSKVLDSQMMITNYSYFLAATSGSNADPDTEWVKRDALIMDEAHDLEKQLVNIAEARINFNDLYKNFGIGDKGWLVSLDMKVNREYFKVLVKDMIKSVEEMNERIEAALKEGTGLKSKPSNIPRSVQEKVKRINSKKQILVDYLSKLSFYLGQADPIENPWVETPNQKDNSIVLSPLTAKNLFFRCMDHLADHFVFLSATLPPADELCRELGLNREEMLYIEVDTPFAAEKSPIHILEVAKMNYKELDAAIPKIVQVVEAILEEHPNEKGIIHTGNYRIAKDILSQIDKKLKPRLIARDVGDMKVHNSQLLKQHYETNKPTVLLSPSMTTGIDLKDDLARFQIIVKLPFPSLADPRIKKKSDIYPDWYLMQMWIEILQAAGRATRNEEDYSITYILDGSFSYFLNKSRPKLPKWFTNRLQ
jgi:Rad3-related DNA helicase